MGNAKTIAEFTENRPAITFAPEDGALSAAAAMKEKTSDCVFVCENKVVVGVFTQRDYLSRLAAVGKADAPLAEVMTRKPKSLRGEDSIETAMKQMAVGNYRNVPIISEEGSAVSHLSIWDVMQYLGERFASDLAAVGAEPVDSLFHRPAVEVETTTTLLNVISLMTQRACGAMRVLQDDKLVGIFTEQDLLHRVDYSNSNWHDVPVAEVMTKDPVQIVATETIAYALSTMNQGGFRHIPVKDDTSSDEPPWMVSIRELLGYVVRKL